MNNVNENALLGMENTQWGRPAASPLPMENPVRTALPLHGLREQCQDPIVEIVEFLIKKDPPMCMGVCEWRALLSWYGNLASLLMFVNTSILSSYFRNLLFQVKGVMCILMFSFTSGLSRRACIISRLAMKIRKEILMPFHLKSLIYGCEKKKPPHPIRFWICEEGF